jgi:CheY-like chemotaxis protein
MKILIVDDHPVLRAGLAALLRQVMPDIDVLEAGSGKDALDIAEGLPDLDVVVLDLVMPVMGGMEALAEFGRRHPALPRIILSSSEEPEEAREALEAGAQAYVPKSAGPQTVAYAIEAVMRGETYGCSYASVELARRSCCCFVNALWCLHVAPRRHSSDRFRTAGAHCHGFPARYRRGWRGKVLPMPEIAAFSSQVRD